MPKCFIHAEYSGPNSAGDYIITAHDRIRGVFNFPLHLGSECLVFEKPAQADDKPAPGTAPFVPPVAIDPSAPEPGPDAEKDELMAYCAKAGIKHHHANSIETLRKNIKERVAA